MPVKKPAKESIKYEASKVDLIIVEKGPTKGSSIIQFTLTILLENGASCKWRNCLAGVSKNGPWAMPPQSKYRTTEWNKKFAEPIIDGFRKSGWFDKLEGPKFETKEEVILEWEV